MFFSASNYLLGRLDRANGTMGCAERANAEPPNDPNAEREGNEHHRTEGNDMFRLLVNGQNMVNNIVNNEHVW